jgi:valyl-tRNA synthetase
MSKSLGTGVDPRRLITKYGADAVRAWAASVAMSSQDVRFDESRVEGYRRFCNKLWNAERLVLGNIGDGPVPVIPEPDELELIEDRWILSRLASAQREVTEGIEGFEFQDSINAAYGCTWNEFCDWWLEAAKDRLKEGDKTAQAVAIFCLDNLLRLLHPFMPFVTEELWSRLPGERDFIMRAPWPEDLHRYVDGQAEVEFERLMDAVNQIRSYRKTIAGAPAKGGAVKLFEHEPEWERALTLLGGVALVDELPPGKSFGLSAGSIVFPAIAAADPLIAAKKKAGLQKELDRVQTKLDNPEFRAKAPEAVIAEQESRADELRAAIDRLD